MISVIIVARTGPEPTLNGLRSLEQLNRGGALEIIVANCCGPVIARQILDAFPKTRIIEISSSNTLFEARRRAFELSTGDPVIMLNERYSVTEAWLVSIDKALRDGADAVAGVVVPGTRLTVWEWSMYLTEYSHITPPVREGLVNPLHNAMLSGNISYKRAPGLAAIQTADSETDFLASLFSTGARVLQSNAMQVEFRTVWTKAEYMAERWQVSRDYARRRARDMGLTARVVAMLQRIMLPPLVTVRVLRNSARKPALRNKILSCLPFVVCLAFVQMIAEIAGYLDSSDAVNNGLSAPKKQRR